jgi:3-dehydroquinate synthase
MTTIRIDLPHGGGYDVVVGHEILPSLGERCRTLGLGDRCALIADAALTDGLARVAADSLRAADFEVLIVPYAAGEEGKNLASVETLVGHMLEAGFDRGAWVIALGGGVVGDLGGFVAASFLRGVDVVQVPTTILAQVDASIGGKTAVNHPLGKNLIGAFHPPRLVLSDTNALRSLPRTEVVSGLAEVVKHGIIRDAELFGFLEERIEGIADMKIDTTELDWLIARNAQIKAEVVSADEREGGLRAILNYGHTIGHAIEAATAYKRYRHGEAVLLGMIAAGELAATRGLWESAAERERHDALIERLGVPEGVDQVDAATIAERTKADKKRIGGRHRFILARRIGTVDIVDGVEDDQVRATVEALQRRCG